VVQSWAKSASAVVALAANCANWKQFVQSVTVAALLLPPFDRLPMGIGCQLDEAQTLRGEPATVGPRIDAVVAATDEVLIDKGDLDDFHRKFWWVATSRKNRNCVTSRNVVWQHDWSPCPSQESGGRKFETNQVAIRSCHRSIRFDMDLIL
jgi:hypothetical protein